jgi:transposase
MCAATRTLRQEKVGHKGDTLKQVEAPDWIERNTASVCLRCCASLTAAMQTAAEKRQVFDLPERLIEVSEHQASNYCCAACGFETKAEFPAGAAAATRSGERIRAAAIYLNVQQLIPLDRVAQVQVELSPKLGDFRPQRSVLGPQPLVCRP